MNDNQNIHLEVLANHYSETFGLLKADTGRRDRLFLYMLVLIFLLLLYMSAPTVMSDWINNFVVSQAGNGGNSPAIRLIDVSFIGTLLWFGFLCLAHTYFQTVLHVERQYNYVYNLEKELSDQFGGIAFSREGKHYRENRRMFASWTKFIFWILSPLLIFLFLVSWELFLFRNSQTEPIYMIMNSLISLSILISMGLYLWALYKKR